MQTVPRSVPQDIQGTLVRMLAYMGGLAVLSIAAASFFGMPAVVATAHPPPRPQWIEVERPHPAFDLLLPELGGNPSRYAILRRDADDARKDVLSWGEAGGSGPYAMVEIYRTGKVGERFIDAPSEIAARIVDFSVVDDVKPAGTIDGKFGSVPLVDFAITAQGNVTGNIPGRPQAPGKERRCLGFARVFNDPSMQIAGWYCSAGGETVSRATIACALDHLTILSAGGDEKLAELFARAEIKRTFCGQRNPILAATPERREHVMALRISKPRGRHRAQ